MGYIGVMEKKMETYWGYIGMMEKKMEITIVYWDYMGVVLESGALGYYLPRTLRVQGFGFRV